MSTRLTDREWDAVITALTFLLAGETDNFDEDVIEAADRALAKLQARDERRAGRG